MPFEMLASTPSEQAPTQRRVSSPKPPSESAEILFDEPEILGNADTYVPSGNRNNAMAWGEAIPRHRDPGIWDYEAVYGNEPDDGTPPIDVGRYANEGASTVYIPGYDEALGEPDEWKRAPAPPLVSEAEIAASRAEAQANYEQRMADAAAKRAKKATAAQRPKTLAEQENAQRLADLKALIARRKREAGNQ